MSARPTSPKAATYLVTACVFGYWLVAHGVGEMYPISPLGMFRSAMESSSRVVVRRADGTLDFPDLGKVTVVGLTPREIEVELARRLKDGGFLLSPQVTVTLEQVLNQRVTVSGAVMNPGVIQYAGEMTVFEAIVRAGQATAAAGDEVLIIRAAAGRPSDSAAAPVQPALVTVNLKELQTGDLRNNLALADGDMVIVREAQDFFISGEVRAPGAYPARAGLTVEQALALAGGLTERGSAKRIEIKRVGVAEILKGVKLDDPVRPGDTVKVNRSIM